jgi:transcription elongation factor Elf1
VEGVPLSIHGGSTRQSLRAAIAGRPSDTEATYVCDSCGEEIVVPVDVSAGSRQDYVEDCPVCCHPMTLHVEIDADGEAHIHGEHE